MRDTEMQITENTNHWFNKTQKFEKIGFFFVYFMGRKNNNLPISSIVEKCNIRFLNLKSLTI